MPATAVPPVLLETWHLEPGIAVLMISHDLNDVFRVADRIAVLYLGRLAALRQVDELDRGTVVQLMATGLDGRGPATDVLRRPAITEKETADVRVQG